jgi:hypothetical protein
MKLLNFIPVIICIVFIATLCIIELLILLRHYNYIAGKHPADLAMCKVSL